MSAPSAKQRAHARDAFEEGAIALFRKAISQRFGFRMEVDGQGGDGVAELLDDDGRVMSSCRLAGVQLALPLASTTETAPTTSAPAVEVIATCRDAPIYLGERCACGVEIPFPADQCPACVARNRSGAAPDTPTPVVAVGATTAEAVPAPWFIEPGDVLCVGGRIVVVEGVDAEGFAWRGYEKIDGTSDTGPVGRTLWAVIEDVSPKGIVTLKTAAPLDVTHALTPDGTVHLGDDTERLAPVIPPIAPPGRTLRPGDLVFAGARGMWLVLRIEGDTIVLVDAHYHEKGITNPDETRVSRASITLDAADLWQIDAAPAPLCDGCGWGVSQVSDGHPVGVSQTPESPMDKPAESLWTLFSVEVPDTHANPMAWAHVKGLAWCCGGYLNWHIEGGASRRGRHRMVAIVPRERAVELLDLCNKSQLTPDMLDVDYGDSLLRAGSRVRRERGTPWLVTAVDRNDQRAHLECDGATIAPDIAEIETTTDGSGDFVLVPLSTALSKASTPKRDVKPSTKKAAKTSPPKPTPAGFVELRVPSAIFAKHRKGLLDLAKQPLGGCWKARGEWTCATVSVGGASSVRVLRYCNRQHIELKIEGSPADIVRAMESGREPDEAPVTEAPLTLPTSGTRTDDGFELFADRGAVPWKKHAKKGRYGLLRHWIDGRIELLATGATEAEVRKHDRSDLMAPGVTEVVVVGRDGHRLGSSSRGHDAYAVPGRWTVVASSERGYLRWQGDDETEARAALERACAVPDGIVVVLVGPDGKEKVERRDGAQSRREVAEDAARDERLPRATRATLRVDQLVRVASSAAGIAGVPVSLAGETVAVVKLGPKLAKVYCRKLGRSYSVPFDALELLGGGAS